MSFASATEGIAAIDISSDEEDYADDEVDTENDEEMSDVSEFVDNENTPNRKKKATPKKNTKTKGKKPRKKQADDDEDAPSGKTPKASNKKIVFASSGALTGKVCYGLYLGCHFAWFGDIERTGLKIYPVPREIERAENYYHLHMEKSKVEVLLIRKDDAGIRKDEETWKKDIMKINLVDTRKVLGITACEMDKKMKEDKMGYYWLYKSEDEVKIPKESNDTEYDIRFVTATRNLILATPCIHRFYHIFNRGVKDGPDSLSVEDGTYIAFWGIMSLAMDYCKRWREFLNDEEGHMDRVDAVFRTYGPAGIEKYQLMHKTDLKHFNDVDNMMFVERKLYPRMGQISKKERLYIDFTSPYTATKLKITLEESKDVLDLICAEVPPNNTLGISDDTKKYNEMEADAIKKFALTDFGKEAAARLRAPPLIEVSMDLDDDILGDSEESEIEKKKRRRMLKNGSGGGGTAVDLQKFDKLCRDMTYVKDHLSPSLRGCIKEDIKQIVPPMVALGVQNSGFYERPFMVVNFVQLEPNSRHLGVEFNYEYSKPPNYPPGLIGWLNGLHNHYPPYIFESFDAGEVVLLLLVDFSTFVTAPNFLASHYIAARPITATTIIDWLRVTSLRNVVPSIVKIDLNLFANKKIKRFVFDGRFLQVDDKHLYQVKEQIHEVMNSEDQMLDEVQFAALSRNMAEYERRKKMKEKTRELEAERARTELDMRKQIGTIDTVVIRDNLEAAKEVEKSVIQEATSASHSHSTEATAIPTVVVSGPHAEAHDADQQLRSEIASDDLDMPDVNANDNGEVKGDEGESDLSEKEDSIFDLPV